MPVPEWFTLCVWWDDERCYLDVLLVVQVCVLVPLTPMVCVLLWVCVAGWIRARRRIICRMLQLHYRNRLRGLCQKWLIWEMCTGCVYCVRVSSSEKPKEGSDSVCEPKIRKLPYSCGWGGIKMYEHYAHFCLCKHAAGRPVCLSCVCMCVCVRAHTLLHLTVCMKEISPHSRAAPLIWKQLLRQAFICSAWIW